MSLGSGFSALAAGAAAVSLTSGGAGAVGPSSPETVAIFSGGVCCCCWCCCRGKTGVEYCLLNDVSWNGGGVLIRLAKDRIRFIRWREENTHEVRVGKIRVDYLSCARGGSMKASGHWQV